MKIIFAVLALLTASAASAVDLFPAGTQISFEPAQCADTLTTDESTCVDVHFNSAQFKINIKQYALITVQGEPKVLVTYQTDRNPHTDIQYCDASLSECRGVVMNAKETMVSMKSVDMDSLPRIELVDEILKQDEQTQALAMTVPVPPSRAARAFEEIKSNAKDYGGEISRYVVWHIWEGATVIAFLIASHGG